MRLALTGILVASTAVAAAAASCATPGTDDGPSTFTPDAGVEVGPVDARDDGFFLGDGSDAVAPSVDFPAEPILDGTVPASSATLFGSLDGGSDAGADGTVCQLEPGPDALFPNNWLRPRFRWSAASGQNLFELRLHSPAERNDLVVYTAATSWTMPAGMWSSLATVGADEPVTVTIRSLGWDGAQVVSAPTLGSQTSFTIAPVPASGTIVYWTVSGGSALKGFRVGDETVQTVLQPGDVAPAIPDGGTPACIGCHTSTPDGKYVGVNTASDTATVDGNVLVSIESGTLGQPPPFLGAGARSALVLPELGPLAFSKAHWMTGDHVGLAPKGIHEFSGIAWFDLEATDPSEGKAWGTLARTGDTRGAAAPTWSHDGKTVAYVSTDGEFAGYPSIGLADIYTVPYGDKQGGAATPVAGASDEHFEEYYPAFSGDDALLAFNYIPVEGSDHGMYDQPYAEVYVVPTAGGTSTRLAANDPPACSGVQSPGIHNSWPKWAPEVKTANGKKYYFLIFSSSRFAQGGEVRQLYMAAVVDDGGKLTTHGAVHLWNQPADESNRTPAWDVFKLPPPH